MKLIKKEFDLIRPLNYYKQQFGDKVYITTDTPELFWFDFMKLIFVKYFKNQKTITSIENFDSTQPVLIEEKDDLELILPPLEESIIYYAKNQKPLTPNLKIPITQNIVLIFSFICFLILFIIKNFTNYGKFKDNYLPI